MLSSARKQWALKRNQGEFFLPDRKEVVNRLLKCFSSKQEPTSDGSKTVISPSAESVDVDSQPMPPSEDESYGASSEAHTTPADTVGVVDAYVIPGNLSSAQPVITSQLSQHHDVRLVLRYQNRMGHISLHVFLRIGCLDQAFVPVWQLN